MAGFRDSKPYLPFLEVLTHPRVKKVFLLFLFFYIIYSLLLIYKEIRRRKKKKINNSRRGYFALFWKVMRSKNESHIQISLFPLPSR
jgi:hypothetical protein